MAHHKTVPLPRMFYYSIISRIPSPGDFTIDSSILCLRRVHIYDHNMYQSNKNRGKRERTHLRGNNKTRNKKSFADLSSEAVEVKLCLTVWWGGMVGWSRYTKRFVQVGKFALVSQLRVLFKSLHKVRNFELLWTAPSESDSCRVCEFYGLSILGLWCLLSNPWALVVSFQNLRALFTTINDSVLNSLYVLQSFPSPLQSPKYLSSRCAQPHFPKRDPPTSSFSSLCVYLWITKFSPKNFGFFFLLLLLAASVFFLTEPQMI